MLKMNRVTIVMATGVAALAGCQAAPSPAPGGQAAGVSGASDDRRQSRSDRAGGGVVPTAPVASPPESAAPRESVQPPTGRSCRVYLRRDALGMAGAAPLAPNLDAPLQRGTVVTGTVDEVTDAWVVLKADSRRVWIPRNMVLMIEVVDR